MCVFVFLEGWEFVMCWRVGGDSMEQSIVCIVYVCDFVGRPQYSSRVVANIMCIVCGSS